MEVVIASALMVVSLVSVGANLGTQFLTITSSSIQQDAAGLLDQAVEQARAVPYQDIVEGLNDSDVTASKDSYINTTTGPWTLNIPNMADEPIVHTAASPTQAPLVPHESTQTIKGTAYTVSAYDTIDTADTGSGPDVYRVAVMVKWTSHGSGLQQISAQTLVYSTGGSPCLSQSNHPFAAPCQPFFYSSASVGGGCISVTGQAGATTAPVSGLSFNSVEICLPTVTTSAEIEQTSTVMGSVTTSGAVISAASQSSAGSVAASSIGNNDPGSADGLSSSTTVAQAPNTLSLSAGPNANSISATPSAGDSGSTTSSAYASATPPCDDLAGTAQSTGLPCGSGKASDLGSDGSLAMSLYAGATSLGSATIADVAAQSVPDDTFVSRLASAGGSYCSTTSGDGCAHAGAQMGLGAVTLAGLPTGVTVVPTDWDTPATNCPTGNYFIALTNYSASVSAESGVNAAVPAVQTPASGGSVPYLCYWTSNGYLSVPVTWGARPPSISFPTAIASDPKIDAGVTVTITPSLTLLPVVSTTVTPAGCTTACSASISVGSPIEGDISYEVTDGNTVVANFMVHVDLGTLAVNTSYQAAP